MGLERLAPPGPGEGPEGSAPTPTKAWGVTAERIVSEQGLRASPKGKKRAAAPRKQWPTREEREAKAERRAAEREQEIAKDPTGYARQACFDLLELGPRTRSELARHLAKKGVPDEAAEEVLGRFAEVGIIDDALFASLWVTSRHRGRGLAGRALSQELRRKGIDDETAREAIAQLDPDQETATARALVQRKLSSTRGLATEARVRRLAGMLARKGYGAGLAFRVVKEELEAEGLELAALDTDALAHLETD